MPDQAGESLLPEFALHTPAVGAGAKGKSRDFDVALAKGDPVGGKAFLGLRGAETAKGGSAQAGGKEVAAGGSGHLPSLVTLYQGTGGKGVGAPTEPYVKPRSTCNAERIELNWTYGALHVE
jgi:hypothetical protein